MKLTADEIARLVPAPGLRQGQFTRGTDLCDRWASNHLGQVDDPPDHGEAVRAAYEVEARGEALTG